ncbi:MAG: hypothetical protein DRN83_02020 [Hadesarchaea archaeon]|nr:MAG: hypothetical protein DRN83_02020 [Hadesarchaea archaeon]HDI12776.1 hypothetical protein [Hadesarchaea archaeon]
MGVTEDVEWLEDDEEGVGKVFRLIAEKGDEGMMLSELKSLYGSAHWWPVKVCVQALIDRDLIFKDREKLNFKLTSSGKKVWQSFRVMEHVREI